MFSVRIVDADFYLTKPVAGLDVLYSDFRQSNVNRVPVVRIFGSTPSGQKTCLHVHQVFPYIFVPYDGTQPSDKYLKQFTTSVDFAVQVALGKASSSTHHVYDASIVKRIPFYGYHEEEQEFIKIQFYNPRIVARVVELLQNGAILNKVFQPYESHIPFILQFLIDFNLYGMNLLHAGKVHFRGWARPETKTSKRQPSPSSESSSPFSSNISGSFHINATFQHWNESTIPSDLRLDSHVPKISRCELEVDVVSTDILNQLEIGTSVGTNPGIVAMWEDEKQRRRDHEQSSQITLPLSQDRGDLPVLDAERDFKARIREIISQRNQLVQSQLDKMEKTRLNSLSPEDFHELSQSILLDTKDPQSPVILSQDVDENMPVVDETVIEDVLQASQSQSERLCTSGRLDSELIDILVSLADDPNQPVLQECSPKSNTSQLTAVEDREVADESENEDEESLVMSQPVWHDEDLSDDFEERDDIEDVEEFDRELQRIPQLDGTVDEESGMSLSESTFTAEDGSKDSCTNYEQASCFDVAGGKGRLYIEQFSERIPQLDGCHDDKDKDQNQMRATTSTSRKGASKSKFDKKEVEEDDDFKTGKRRKAGVVKRKRNSLKTEANLTTRQRKSVVAPLIVSGGNVKARKVSSRSRGKSISEATTSKDEQSVKSNKEKYGDKAENTRLDGEILNSEIEDFASGSIKRTPKGRSIRNGGEKMSSRPSQVVFFDSNTDAQLSSGSQTSDFELRLSDNSTDNSDCKNPKKILKVSVVVENQSNENLFDRVKSETSQKDYEFKSFSGNEGSGFVNRGEFQSDLPEISEKQENVKGRTVKSPVNSQSISKPRERKRTKKAGCLEFTQNPGKAKKAAVVRWDVGTLTFAKDSSISQKRLRSTKPSKEGDLRERKRKKTDSEEVEKDLSVPQEEIVSIKQVQRIPTRGRVLLDACVKLERLSVKREKSEENLDLKDSEKIENSDSRVESVHELSSLNPVPGVSDEGSGLSRHALYQMAMLSPKSVRSDESPSFLSSPSFSLSPPFPSSPSLDASIKVLASSDKISNVLLDISEKCDKEDVVCVEDSFFSTREGVVGDFDVGDGSERGNNGELDSDVDVFSKVSCSSDCDWSQHEGPNVPSHGEMSRPEGLGVPSHGEMSGHQEPNVASHDEISGHEGLDVASHDEISGQEGLDVPSHGEILGHEEPNVSSHGEMSDHQEPDVSSQHEMLGHEELDVASHGEISGHEELDVPSHDEISGHEGLDVPSHDEISGHEGLDVPSLGEMSGHEGPNVSSHVEMSGHQEPDVSSQDEMLGHEEPNVLSHGEMPGHQESDVSSHGEMPGNERLNVRNHSEMSGNEGLDVSNHGEVSGHEVPNVPSHDEMPGHEGPNFLSHVEISGHKGLDVPSHDDMPGHEGPNFLSHGEISGHEGLDVPSHGEIPGHEGLDVSTHGETPDYEEPNVLSDVEMLGHDRPGVPSLGEMPEHEGPNVLSDGEISRTLGQDGHTMNLDDNTRGILMSQEADQRIPSCSFSQKMSGTCQVWKPTKNPPSPTYVLKTRDLYGLPHERHQKAFCSDPKDVPSVLRTVGVRRLHVPSLSVDELSEFDLGGDFLTLCQIRGLMGESIDNSFVKGCLKTLSTEGGITDNGEYMGSPTEIKLALMGEHETVITPAKLPPSPNAVREWLEQNRSASDNVCVTKGSGILNPNGPCAAIGPQTVLPQEKIETSNAPRVGIVENLEAECETTCGDIENPGGVASGFQSPQFSGRSGVAREMPQSRKEGSVSQNGSCVLIGPQHSTPLGSQTKFRKLFQCTPIDAGETCEKAGKPSSQQEVGEQCPRIGALRRNILTNQIKETAVQEHRQASFDASCIEGPTPTNSCGFKISQPNIQDAKSLHEVQYLTLLSVELHIHTRKRLRPDPEFDAICAIFYNIEHDTKEGKKNITGVIVANNESTKLNCATDPGASTSTDGVSSCDNVANRDTGVPKGTSVNRTSGSSNFHDSIMWKAGFANDFDLITVGEECDAIARFIQLVHAWDPDILVGFEVQMLSWGYLLQRSTTLGVDLATQLSRLQDSSGTTRFDAEKNRWGASHTSEIAIAGRIVLNVWRLMRHEVTLNIYTFENIAYHVLHERIPLYTFQQLARWWDQKLPHDRWRTAEHYITRCQGNIRILNYSDLINRTSEFARLYGILFYSVISRGSQFRVESMMLRLAKPMNYLAVSPSIQQRARMCAPECIPLVMEPESRLYTDPVVVLDFQSLYPSMIIAYNYCFSTCLGRVSRLDEFGTFDFGCTSMNVPPALLEKIENDIHVSANGAAFVKSNVRRGILPRMLEEILNTRVMVKKAMKEYKQEKALGRLLDARQLGLKLIANVTYGYTSANFSGRMPCVEIADAIVRKARETLERAIHLVNTREEWGARVVYGDTDSLFVLLKGATKEEAFKIGKDIVDAVTASNPKPVKLKFEKVYLPCVLQTKKRYVGYMYETLDQKQPDFDAKGIETVRRDTCPAVAKILEKSLRILFEAKDVSLVKKFVQRQFRKLMEDRISLQDFIFAKEYRGMRNYKPSACVPALELARRKLSRDRRSEPRVGERVPYVVVYGSPGLPLIQLVRSPDDVLEDPNLRLNAPYYINKQILPPLNRAFALIGIDVTAWYSELPRYTPRLQVTTAKQKTTISRYFTTLHCPVCEELTRQGLCYGCNKDPQKAVIVLADRIRTWERKYDHLAQICFQCCATRDPQMFCVSFDCPVLFKVVKTQRKLNYAETLRSVQRKIEVAEI